MFINTLNLLRFLFLKLLKSILNLKNILNLFFNNWLILPNKPKKILFKNHLYVK